MMLPPGLHTADLQEIEAVFATNPWRRQLFAGLLDGGGRLRLAGCRTLYLDGSFVTGKPKPNDYDACWDPLGIDGTKIDPVFLDFSNGRAAQKATFRGEYFPSSMVCMDVSQTFIDFFQLDRFTGGKKGILCIDLSIDRLLLQQAQP